VQSIAADDAIDPGRTLAPLEAALDDRRCRISIGAPVHVREYWCPGDELPFHQSSPLFTAFPPDLAGYEVTDEDGRQEYVSPYEDVGRELAERIDNLRYAMTKASREQAASELKDFEGRLLGRDGPGRRRKFANTTVLKQAASELVRLLRLLRDVNPPPMQAAVRVVLSRELGTEDERELWRWRLTLPILSKIEIRDLVGLPSSNRGALHRLALQLLAHRLQVLPSDLARHISGNAAGSRLEGVPNPFSRGASRPMPPP
jgi:hypothetical protein